MSIVQPSNPRDVQDFKFKLSCRLRIFANGETEFTSASNLVASASKYGLIFVGFPGGLQVIQSKSLVDVEPRSCSGEVTDYPRRVIPLPSQPSHISVSCDQSLICVAVLKDGCAHGLIYSVTSFAAKQVHIVSEVRLTTSPEVCLLELAWNPGFATILACCLSNGVVSVFEFKSSGVDINQLPPETNSTCLCWSPKGKQLVVGDKRGSLTHYKPDLKPVKTLPAPGPSIEVVNVLWLSTFQFAAVYRNTADPSERPGIMIVNAPKAGPISFVNYEDICYSNGELRKPQFYLYHLPQWNALLVASANSIEVGVLGLKEDNTSWEQWIQEDAARAELPMTAEKEETYPVGFGWDTSSQTELPWGENQKLPPMPRLLLLSHKGLLCVFHAINFTPGAPQLNSAPEQFTDQSGLSLFVVGSPATNNLSSLRVNLTQRFESMGQIPGSTEANMPGFGAKPGPAFSFGSGISAMPSVESSSIAITTTPQLEAKSAFSFTPGFGQVSSSTEQPQPPGTDAAKSAFSFSSTLGSVSSSSVEQPKTFLDSKSPFSFGSAAFPSSSEQAKSSSVSDANRLSAFNFSSSGSALMEQSKAAGTDANKSAFSFGPATAQPAGQQAKAIGTDANKTFTFGSALGPPVVEQPKPVGSEATKPAFSFVSSLGSGVVADQNRTADDSKASFSFSSSLGGLSSAAQTGGSFSPAAASVNPTVIEPAEPSPLPTPRETTPQSATPEPEEAPPINSSVFLAAIRDEKAHFEHELQQLRARAANVNVEVGSEAEKVLLCTKLEALSQFCSELKETTAAQSSEIHSLKAVTMEAFAWAEEARSRLQQSSNPRYLQLARSQELDPLTSRYAGDVRHMVYYVESQLRQMNQCLDCKWLDFQDSCKADVRNKMYVPSLESVYQAMVLHNNILNRQRAVVGDLVQRVAEWKRKNNLRRSLISSTALARTQNTGESDLSKLAESLVQMSVNPSGPPSPSAAASHRLSSKKRDNLREYLGARQVVHVRPTKPTRTNLLGLPPFPRADVKPGGISTGKPIVSPSNKLPTAGTTFTASRSSDVPVAVSVPDTTNITNKSAFGMSTTTFQQKSGQNKGFSFTASIDKSQIIVDGVTSEANTKSSAFKFSAPSSSAFHFASKGLDSSPGEEILEQKSPLLSLDSIVANIGEGGSNFGAGRTGGQKSFSFGETKSSNEPFTFESQAVKPALKDTFTSSASTTVSMFGGSVTKPIPATGNMFGGGGLVSSTPKGGLANGVKKPLAPFSEKSGAAPDAPSKSSMSGSLFVDGAATSAASGFFKAVVPSSKSVAMSMSTTTCVTTTVTSSAVSVGFGSVSNPSGSSLFTSSAGTVFGSSLAPATSSIFGGNTSVQATTSETLAASTPSAISFGSSTFSPKTLPGVTVSVPTPTTSVPVRNMGIMTKSGSPVGSVPVAAVTSGGSTEKPTLESIFGPPTTLAKNIFGGTTVTSSPGETTVVSTSATNIFGSSSATTTAVTASSHGEAATTKTTTVTSTSMFGGSAPSSTTLPAFSFVGAAATSTTTTTASIFGSASVTSGTAATFSFGGTAAAPTTENIFGSSTSPAPTATNIFGGSVPVSATENVITVSASTAPSAVSLGNTSGDAVTTAASCGSAATTTKETISISPSAFGGSSGVSPATPSGFGALSTAAVGTTASTASTTVTTTVVTTSTPTVSASSGGLFGTGSPSVTSAQPTLFGSAVTSGGSLFGSTTSSTTGSMFGGTATTPTAATTSPENIFGGGFKPPDTQQKSTPENEVKPASIFGQGTSPTKSDSQLSSFSFGQLASSIDSATDNKSSPFGGGSAATSPFRFDVQGSTSTSAFGLKPSVFSSPNGAATTSTTTSSQTSFFGQPICSPSSFGQSGGSLFGQTTTTSPSTGLLFGQTSATPSTGAFGGKPTFGQSGGSLFGQTSTFGSTGGSMFGGSSFGAQPSGSVFQSGGGGMFGGAGSTNESAGPFSSGQQTISQSGFGSPSAFGAKPGGFGSPPAFGGSPTFGGAPIFGGSASFGSPPKVFGSTSPPAVGFGTGSPTQQSETFGNLATQNTVTFGNLAQNQNTGFGSAPQQPLFGASAPVPEKPAFSSGSSFGGSSFCSWR